VIVGRYTRDREIGRGGMGAVWLGRDEVLGRPVAIKGVGMAPGGSAPDLARAEREAKIAASLNHPNIVGVFDLVTDDDQQWLVMEYVEGTTLGELVRTRGALDPDEAAPILAQAASALVAAHANGIVHRDVKPSNILVREDGLVKLTDFGIARAQADAALTQTGLVTGSPAYLPPEIASGRPATTASDAWSLGATLFHALAGHPPYDATGNVLGALYRIVHEDPPQPEDAGWLAPLLEATMTKDPADRWPMTRIEQFLETRGRSEPATRSVPTPAPVPAPTPSPTQTLAMTDHAALPASAVAAAPVAVPPGPPGPPGPPAGPTGRPPHRRPVLPAVIAVLVAVLVVAIVVLALQDDPQENLASDPTGRSSTPSPDAGTASTPASTPPTPEPPTVAELEDFVSTYLATASSDPDAGFDLLTPAFQRQSPDYEGFWGSVSNPRILDFSADPDALTVQYTYTYQLAGQGRRKDLVRLQLAETDDGFLIAGEA
jgi:serine/threonine protein kinase